MRLILSPAKKMRVDTDSFVPSALPRFLPEAEEILSRLRELDDRQLQALWKCSDSIAAENIRRVREMDLRRGLTPALMAYDGIQYQYMAPGVLDDRALRYVEEHLRILSGFYGLLRPFDGVAPYRLEMQARLAVGSGKDLYAYWGRKLADALAEETDTVIDLASAEYSRAALPHLPGTVRVIRCVFGQLVNGKVVEKGTLCKMARGRMVRFLAERDIREPEGLQEFDGLTYAFSPERSSPEEYVFLPVSTPVSPGRRPEPEF